MARSSKSICPQGRPVATNMLLVSRCVGHRIASSFNLNEHGLAALPLAREHNNHAHQCYYAPNPFGLWVCVGATDAAMFLMEWLDNHHRELLDQCMPAEHRTRLLQSTPAQLSLLRSLRTCLPTRADLQGACAKAAHKRIAFKDGFLDTATGTFHSLPYKTDHYVLATLNLCHAQASKATPGEVEEARALLSAWFPEPCELCWLLR